MSYVFWEMYWNARGWIRKGSESKGSSGVEKMEVSLVINRSIPYKNSRGVVAIVLPLEISRAPREVQGPFPSMRPRCTNPHDEPHLTVCNMRLLI